MSDVTAVGDRSVTSVKKEKGAVTDCNTVRNVFLILEFHSYQIFVITVFSCRIDGGILTCKLMLGK